MSYKRKEKEYTSRLNWLHSYVKQNPFIEEIQLWDSVLFTKSSVGRAKFKSQKDLVFPKSYKLGATIVFPSPGRGKTWTAKDKKFFLEHCCEDQERYNFSVFKISSLMITDKFDSADYLDKSSFSVLPSDIKEIKMAHRFVTLMGSIAGLACLGDYLKYFLNNLKFSTRKTKVNQQAIINKIKATPHLIKAIGDPHYGYKQIFGTYYQSASAEELECLKQTRQLLGIPHTEPTEPPEPETKSNHKYDYSASYAPLTWKEILDYNPGDTLKDIKIKWKRKALEYHPDISSDPDATTKMAEINNAYDEAKEFFANLNSNMYAGIP